MTTKVTGTGVFNGNHHSGITEPVLNSLRVYDMAAFPVKSPVDKSGTFAVPINDVNVVVTGETIHGAV